MGILFPFTGWLLNRNIAGGAMAFSSVSIITNACVCGTLNRHLLDKLAASNK